MARSQDRGRKSSIGLDWGKRKPGGETYPAFSMRKGKIMVWFDCVAALYLLWLGVKMVPEGNWGFAYFKFPPLLLGVIEGYRAFYTLMKMYGG